MKAKLAVSFFLFCIISLILQACNFPGTPPLTPPTARSNPQISVTVFNPSEGAVFSLDAPIDLTALVSPLSGSLPTINRREFLINGASAASTRAEAGSFYGTWAPTRPGEYYVQGKVTLGDGTVAISEPVRVCVLIALGALPGVDGYLGPCPLPTQVPDHASSGDPVIFAVAAPDPITFSADAIYCPMPLPTVTFIATVDDPQDLVALVMLSYSNASGGYWNFQYLNWVTTRPVNQKEYRTTVQLINSFAADTSLHWYIQAYGRSGEFLRRTQDFTAIRQVECSSHPLQIASPSALTDTLTPEILSVVTPTATVTQRILYIASPTRKPRKNNGNGNPTPVPTQPCNKLIQVCP